MNAPPGPPFIPPRNPRCPPGMEYIIPAPGLIVAQHLEPLEMMTGFEMNNRYDVCDPNGIRMYLAAETTDVVQRQILSAKRNFTIMILDNSGVPVLCIQRFFIGDGCTCTGNVLRILTPDAANVYGEVTEDDCCQAKFSVTDAQGKIVMTIDGPTRSCCGMSFGDVAFILSDESNNTIGRILKHYKGYIQEQVSDATTYTVEFPAEFDPIYKCLILGAVFLIDFMFFEALGGGAHRRHGYHRRYSD